MRIIRPLDDMAAVTTSNAPDDAITKWEVQGRDLLLSTHNPTVDTYGDMAIIAGRNGVFKVTMSTGVVVRLFKINEETGWVKISPNGEMVALSTLRRLDGAQIIRVLSTSTGNELTHIEGSTGNSTFAKNIVAWSGDSTYMWYLVYDKIRVTEVGSFGSMKQLGPIVNAKQIAVVGESAYVLSEFYDTGRPVITRYSYIGGSLAKENNYVTDNIGTRPNTVYGFFFNSTRNKITLLRTQSEYDAKVFYELDPLTLDGIETSTHAYVDMFPSVDTIDVTDTHFIARSASTSPYWNYYNLSDYQLDSGIVIPDLRDTGFAVSASSSYTVIANTQGYSLIDNTTRELIAQQNPNVVKGDTYIYNDRVYEVLTNNNVQPDEGAAAEPPTWLDLGAINRLRMFDNKIDSVTRGNGTLSITIDAKQALNGIALFNVTSATVQITMTDGTYGLVYDTGEVLMRDTSQIRGWYDWFFSKRPEMRDLARIDLPTFPNAIVEVTLTGNNVSLGEIVLGRVQKIGETQYGGTSVGIIDSSIKERDDFGNFIIAERPFSKRVEFDVHVPTSGISGVQNILAGYRAKPVVYVGAEGEEALVVFGFYRDFQINYTSYSIAASTITVEGL